ncbi:MAG: hypothetical protein DRQ51_02455 [Gammaproteobacteria bacterium]|nr:MAG: hypothetical protein DRQ51_02455 [Gammaproteobacteria bacterium]
MKSVYLESSVISYISSNPSRDLIVSARQIITMDWWTNHKKEYNIFVSELTIKEISLGSDAQSKKRLSLIEGVEVLETTENAKKLAKILIKNRVVPKTSAEDALHIAISAVQNIDFLLTWNFKHINNANTKEKIKHIIEKNDYNSPILCSPEELNR